MRGELWAQRFGLMALVLLATRGVACTYATPKVEVPEEVPRFSPHQLRVTEVTVKNRNEPLLVAAPAGADGRLRNTAQLIEAQRSNLDL